ncbi:hypothetical protein VUR80DRAFT_3679 [Thermomyces stellatus]
MPTKSLCISPRGLDGILCLCAKATANFRFRTACRLWGTIDSVVVAVHCYVQGTMYPSTYQPSAGVKKLADHGRQGMYCADSSQALSTRTVHTAASQHSLRCRHHQKPTSGNVVSLRLSLLNTPGIQQHRPLSGRPIDLARHMVPRTLISDTTTTSLSFPASWLDIRFLVLRVR